MAVVFVSLGSNIEPEQNLRSAVEALRNAYGPLHLSSVYRSPATGFDGDDFLNAVLSFEFSSTPRTLVKELRSVENDLGRRRDGPKFSSRTVDLDLLLYGDIVVEEENFQLPHRDIEKYSFVLVPLAEIAGERIHPRLKRTFAELSTASCLEPKQLERLDTFAWNE